MSSAVFFGHELILRLCPSEAILCWQANLGPINYQLTIIHWKKQFPAVNFMLSPLYTSIYLSWSIERIRLNRVIKLSVLIYFQHFMNLSGFQTNCFGLIEWWTELIVCLEFRPNAYHIRLMYRRSVFRRKLLILLYCVGIISILLFEGVWNYASAF